MTFHHFSLLCLILFTVDDSFGNSLSGTFQSCQISCNNNDGSIPIPPTSTGDTVMVGKKGPKGSKGERGRPGHNCNCTNLTPILAKLEDLENKYNEINQRMAAVEEKLSRPRSCLDVKRSDRSAYDGVYVIYPFTDPNQAISVFCDMTTDGGGWIVIQKRFDGSVDFFRDWADYVKGFGDKNGEHWIGLENIHLLTMGRNVQLRIDLKDFSDNEGYAQYNTFFIGAANDYTLNFGEYSGNVGDAFGHENGGRHRGARFSTKDNDQDTLANNRESCANEWSGAWWYKGCFYGHLNGLYVTQESKSKNGEGIIWMTWKNAYTPLKASEMKIRSL